MSGESRPKLSAVVLVDHGHELTGVLDALAAGGLEAGEFEAVLAAPCAAAARIARTCPPWARIVAGSAGTRGARAAAAVRASGGAFLVLLDEDMAPAPGALARLASALDADPTSCRTGRVRYGRDAGADALADFCDRSWEAQVELNPTPGASILADGIPPVPLALTRAAYEAAGGFDPELPGALGAWLDSGLRLAGLPGVTVDPDFAVRRLGTPTLEALLARAEMRGEGQVLLAGRRPGVFVLDHLKDLANGSYLAFGEDEIARWSATIARIVALPAELRPQRTSVNPRGDEFETAVLDWLVGLAQRAAQGKGCDRALRHVCGPDWHREFFETCGLYDPRRMHVPPKPKTARASAGPSADRPLLSVVIPVRNGAGSIGRCLASFAAQTLDPSRYEIVVANDGSTDDTAAVCRGLQLPCAVRVLDLPPSGQGPATNVAIRAAAGDYVLLSAGDIVAHPELLDRHLGAHLSARDEIGVLGYLPYHPDLPTDPFMEFIVSDGTQFGYAYIKDPNDVPPTYAYAPNLSYWRETLVDAGGFDEDYVWGMQDIDLGVRMRLRGVRMIYDPRAIGWHWHPTTLEHYLWHRQPFGGHACVVFAEKWPYLLPLDDLRRTCLTGYTTLAAVPGLIERLIAAAHRCADLEATERPVFETRDPMLVGRTGALAWIYEHLLRFAYAKGIQDELVQREGADWDARWLAGAGRTFRHDPERALQRIERRLAAVETYLVRPRPALDVLQEGGLTVTLRHAPAHAAGALAGPVPDLAGVSVFAGR